MTFKHAGLAAVLLLSGVSGLALAQAPAAAPPTPPIAGPEDVAYPGVIELEVDASDVTRGILSVRQVVPVAKPGTLTLLYPEWLPGNHAPRGPIDKLAGLTITSEGRTLPWRRDPVNMYAFHVDPPAGARAIEVRFQHLSPTAPNQGRITVTPEMLNLQWNTVALYPAGHHAAKITYAPTLKLPEGWRFGGALDIASQAGAVTVFKPVDLETLVDSPLFAGRHFKQVELTGGPAPVRLNMVADRADQLDYKPEHIEAHKRLVEQALKLFGARHYNRYEFLLAMSDRLGGIGLEHHQSSENAPGAGYFTDWDKTAPARDLLPHEVVHSWNGKFRRGADLYTPNYDVPMRDSLLWVYEGQTQFWGEVLAARSGLWTTEQALQSLALTAAAYDTRIGRTWRPLVDTTNDPIVLARRPQAWRSWQRGEDYYSEGQLIWLEADMLIRERSRGKRSLDDFAKRFFGVEDGRITPLTYTFDDVVAALNAVEPDDWATFLTERVINVAPKAPLEGLTRGGWRLVYDEKPTDFAQANAREAKNADYSYSIGLTIANSGAVSAVVWDGPAFTQGVRVADEIVAVNGQAYSSDALDRAITAAKGTDAKIELLVKSATAYRTVTLDYHAGLRYPRLERIPGAPDRLSQLYAARK